MIEAWLVLGVLVVFAIYVASRFAKPKAERKPVTRAGIIWAVAAALGVIVLIVLVGTV